MASSARIEELRKKFEENPRRYFAPLANEYRKAGDVDQAIAICREYLPQQPGHMSGHIVYGQALFEARQVEEARTVFETALSLDPENLIALRHLGDLALLVGDSAAARTWYGRVLEADPRNEEIQAQLATLDQPASAAPTPVASLNIPAPVAAPVEKPVPPAKPTPSSAPTVVMQSPVKSQPWAAKKEPASPPAPVTAQSPTAEIRLDSLPTAQSPTAEIRLDSLPTAAPQEVEKLQDMTIGLEPTSIPAPAQSASAATLEIDVPVSSSKERPPLDSFSLEGLETTSLAAPPVESLSTAATVPLPLTAVFGSRAESPAAESSPASLPPAPAAASEDDPPLLDIGEIPSIPVAAGLSTPSVPPSPAASDPFSFAPPSQPAAPTVSASEPETQPELAWGAQSSQVEPLAGDAVPAPESGPFVTETMAELYLQQGHREEALRVYRALLDQRPDDRLLRERVAELSVPAALAPEADTPSAAAAEPAPAIAAAGPTIRELLNAFAVRRPGFRPEPVHENGAAAEPSPAPAPEPMPEYEPSSGDALAVLFDALQIAPADEGAATALAYAFIDLDGLEKGSGAGPEQIQGAPARHAANELSLDAVFQTGEPPAPSAPSSFSFDQFFSQRATAENVVQSGVPAVSTTESRDDVAQFNQWLEGLKQR